MKENNISRKQFLKSIGWLAAIPYLLFAIITTRRYQRVNTTKIIRLVKPDSDGILFRDDVIMVTKNKDLNIFSARCSHLGCKINKVENGILVCPCHGSAFSENGKVIKGPAENQLKQLEYAIDPETNEIIIQI